MLVIAATAVMRNRDAACLACPLEESASSGAATVLLGLSVGEWSTGSAWSETLRGGGGLNSGIPGVTLLGTGEFWFWLWLVILLVCGLFEIR